RAGGGLRRLRHRRPHAGRAHGGPCQRRPRRLDLPFRRDPRGRGEGAVAGGRRRGAHMSLSLPEDLVFDAAGLLPVIVQEQASGAVLMLAYANAEALARTVEPGYAHFWSRSRQALWKKGEPSGHVLRVRELRADCDRDALLLVAAPEGPTCHTGGRTCFGE